MNRSKTQLFLIFVLIATSHAFVSFAPPRHPRRHAVMLHGEPTTDSSPTPAVASVPTFCSIAFISDEKGRGVVATSVIPVHTVIGDYSGEQITEAVKDRRYLKSREAERDAHDLKWLASRLERGQGVSGDYLFGVSGVDAFIDAEDGESNSNGAVLARHLLHYAHTILLTYRRSARPQNTSQTGQGS